MGCVPRTLPYIDYSFHTVTNPLQEEAEAAKAAAAPGWSGDIAWDEAVTVAMAEAPRGDETEFDREARVLKSVLEADIVPDNKMGKVWSAAADDRW